MAEDERLVYRRETSARRAGGPGARGGLRESRSPARRARPGRPAACPCAAHARSTHGTCATGRAPARAWTRAVSATRSGRPSLSSYEISLFVGAHNIYMRAHLPYTPTVSSPLTTTTRAPRARPTRPCRRMRTSGSQHAGLPYTCNACSCRPNSRHVKSTRGEASFAGLVPREKQQSV